MNAQTQAVAAPVPKLSQELDDLKPQLEKVLPAHVSPDKFMRVVMTAIAQSPDLRNADRASLLTSCVKCATDGLLPDGREAALVIFNTKAKLKEIRDGKEIQVERWINKVQYMPMVGGILKKVRNSGELLSISSNIAYEKDIFRYWTDDLGEHITFEPNLKEADRGALLCAFAIAKTKDGGVYMEVMSRGQIEQVKAVSKSGNNGPWGSWYSEMARKSVIRRLSKRLPMSTDLEAVIHRDDELYELSQKRMTAGSGTEATKRLLGLPMLPDADDVAAADAAAGENANKCDGNHGGPRCADPECWNDDEVVDKTTGEVVTPKPLDPAAPIAARVAQEIGALQGAGNKKELAKVWSEIKAAYKKDKAAPPLDVETAYTDVLAEIKE